jgi:phage FluMu gp28-like protein
MNTSAYFLPYQIAWLEDDSKIKIWEKSRRIGATYVQAFEDVRDCIEGKVPAVWFSSADESAAREYILYCETWARVFNAVAKRVDEDVIDEKGIKTFVLEFKNKRRINALSSSPKRFRSKGGKVVLDEFAFHKDALAMWQAARPAITWGYPLRILSTHNGKSSLFYRFLESIQKGKLKWSHHKTDIYTAVDQGLVDKILGRATSLQERINWLNEQREDCYDETTWLQEFCCEAIDEATAFLTYEMLYSVERDDLLRDLEQITGDLYIGMDIGRKRHLSVIWGLEKLGNVKYTRFVRELEKAKFSTQRDVLFAYLQHPNLRRACIDATGLGMQLAEEAQEAFGSMRIEAVTFNANVKEEMAYQLYTAVEDRTVLIPADHVIREDLHSVRKIVTAAGNVRFDVQSNNDNEHADRFWALALANHAATASWSPISVVTRKTRKMLQMLKGY